MGIWRPYDGGRVQRCRGLEHRKSGLERGRGGLEGGLKHTFAGYLGVFRGVLGASEGLEGPQKGMWRPTEASFRGSGDGDGPVVPPKRDGRAPRIAYGDPIHPLRCPYVPWIRAVEPLPVPTRPVPRPWLENMCGIRPALTPAPHVVRTQGPVTYCIDTRYTLATHRACLPELGRAIVQAQKRAMPSSDRCWASGVRHELSGDPQRLSQAMGRVQPRCALGNNAWSAS